MSKKVEIRRDGNFLIIELFGKICLGEGVDQLQEIERQLSTGQFDHGVFDKVILLFLEKNDAFYIDSQGLASVVKIYCQFLRRPTKVFEKRKEPAPRSEGKKPIRPDEHTFALVTDCNMIEQLWKMVKLTGIIPVFPTIEEAKLKLSAKQPPLSPGGLGCC